MPPFYQILQDAQAGDVESVESLVAKYSPMIAEECGKYGLWQHPDWSQSDLMQEVMLRIWMKLDQFKGVDTDNPEVVFGQWIRTTARNVLNSLHRHRMAKKRMPDRAPKVFDEVTEIYSKNRNSTPSAGSQFVRDEEAERLQAAMSECLDQQGQLVLNLRVVEGLSLKQISERLSLSYDQVRYKFEKSLAELQKKLAQK